MTRRDNWVWINEAAWNLNCYHRLHIYDRGDDYQKRYCLIGDRDDCEDTFAVFADLENANDALDRLLGHIE